MNEPHHTRDARCNAVFAECICELLDGHDGAHSCARDGCAGMWTGDDRGGELPAPVRMPTGWWMPGQEPVNG